MHSSSHSGLTHPSASAVAGFPRTHWSVVLVAARSTSPRSHEALAQLCAAYWHPLYAFIRRRGNSAEEAKDLTQAFFARLLAKQSLKGISDGGGRFRSFLLAAVKHFLANEWHKLQAQKRGGTETILSLDTETAEGRYQVELAGGDSPELVFERRWAWALLDQVIDQLRADYVAKGKGKLFESLRTCLSGDPSYIPYAQLGAELALSEGAVKVAVHRLRKRYGELLRVEIAKTVSRPEDIHDEIRHLISVLSPV
jgi:RNA polymerase sigma factor (sigma-70 family)